MRFLHNEIEKTQLKTMKAGGDLRRPLHYGFSVLCFCSNFNIKTGSNSNIKT